MIYNSDHRAIETPKQKGIMSEIQIPYLDACMHLRQMFVSRGLHPAWMCIRDFGWQLSSGEVVIGLVILNLWTAPICPD